MSFGTEPIVLACPCGHTEPQNIVCPYTPGVTCGGSSHCGICRANTPIGQSPSLPEKNQEIATADSPTQEYPSWVGQLGFLTDTLSEVQRTKGIAVADALMARLKFVAAECL